MGHCPSPVSWMRSSNTAGDTCAPPADLGLAAARPPKMPLAGASSSGGGLYCRPAKDGTGVRGQMGTSCPRAL